LPGVREVSMSFGSPEFASETSYDKDFVAPGVVFFGSVGDIANQTDYPAMSPNVVCVGGTALMLSPGQNVVSEVAWDGGGGGPSKYEKIPPFQSSISKIVGNFRGGPDIALNADPGTPCDIYDSTPSDGLSGWILFGGTSVATAICAGIANLSDHHYQSSAQELSHIYSGLDAYFRDIVTGTSGKYQAMKGWDFCTGVGVPIRNLSL